MKLQRFVDRAALDAALADALRAALEAGGPVMLSGGSTPKPAYAQLGRQALRSHGALTVLFSDDRYVPSDAAASNYAASRPLLEMLPQGTAVLRVRTELALDAAAADYEQSIAQLLKADALIRLGILGLGGDGHTASLFSSSDLERAKSRLAIAVDRPDGLQAVSVTPTVLARCARLLIVVPGHDKRDALSRLLAHDATLIAWRAIEGNPGIELWCEADCV